MHIQTGSRTDIVADTQRTTPERIGTMSKLKIKKV
jgi:hypothetical protein